MSARVSSVRGSWLAVTLAGMLVSSPARGALDDDAPGAAAAAPSSPKKDALELVASSEMVRVEVDSSLLDAEYIALWVRDDVQKVLDERGVQPKHTERRLVVRVTGTDQDRQLEVRVVEGGKAVGDAEPASSCGCITQSELLAAVRTRVEARLPDLVAKPESNSPAHTNGGTNPPHGDSDRPPKKLHALGKTGIGLLVAGATLTAVGIGLAVRGTSESDDEFAVTDLRPAGYACLGVGLGVAVAGATMLGVDVARSRRRARASATPTVGRGFVGFTVSGRF